MDHLYDIYQIDPEKDEHLGGQFLVVTQSYEWGVQGYLLLEFRDDGSLVRFDGRAYIRKKWDHIRKIGAAIWVSHKKSD